MATPKAIAEWMLEELKQETILCQEVVAQEISLLFGEAFTYTNANGDLAIDERVLGEFRNLTANMVISVGGERVWRLKQYYQAQPFLRFRLRNIKFCLH